MKALFIPIALAAATVMSGAPASASPSSFLGAHKLIRGIPVYDRLMIRGIVFRPKYMIRGVVVDRRIKSGILSGPLVRGVPVERGF